MQINFIHASHTRHKHPHIIKRKYHCKSKYTDKSNIFHSSNQRQLCWLLIYNFAPEVGVATVLRWRGVATVTSPNIRTFRPTQRSTVSTVMQFDWSKGVTLCISIIARWRSVSWTSRRRSHRSIRHKSFSLESKIMLFKDKMQQREQR